MALTPEEELQRAIKQWLAAREHFHGGNGVGVLDEYWEADRLLLTAFAAGWNGCETILSVAYHHFRRRLAEEHERRLICWRQSELLT